MDGQNRNETLMHKETEDGKKGNSSRENNNLRRLSHNTNPDTMPSRTLPQHSDSPSHMEPIDSRNLKKKSRYMFASCIYGCSRKIVYDADKRSFDADPSELFTCSRDCLFPLVGHVRCCNNGGVKHADVCCQTCGKALPDNYDAVKKRRFRNLGLFLLLLMFSNWLLATFATRGNYRTFPRHLHQWFIGSIVTVIMIMCIWVFRKVVLFLVYHSNNMLNSII